MLDHAATVFLADTAPAALFFHAVGQIAAPIMCFFIAEGYAYTSNLKKYLLRLFIAAVISHVPYALCFKFTVWEFWYVTVSYTHLLPCRYHQQRPARQPEAARHLR